MTRDGDSTAPRDRSSREGRPVARRLLRIGVSTGLVVGLVAAADLGEVALVLRKTDLKLLLAAFGVYLGGQALSAFKWMVLARGVGFQARFRDCLRFYFRGMFFNAFGFGTVGGDVVRALALGRSEGRRALAVNTVLADRLSGLLVLLGVGLVSLVSFRNYELPAVLYWSMFTVSATLVCGWRLVPVLLPFVLGEDHRVRRLVEDDLAPYWKNAPLLLRASLLSLAFHLSQIGLQALVAMSLGLSIPTTYFFVFGPLVSILSAVPISVNGLGVREGGYVFFLTHIGLGAEVGLGFGLVWFALTLAGGAVGGLTYVGGRTEPERFPGQPRDSRSERETR